MTTAVQTNPSTARAPFIQPRFLERFGPDDFMD